MSRAVVIFTCTRDVSFLKLTLLALRAVAGNVRTVLCIEEKDTEFPRADFPDCEIVVQPYNQPRGGSLNGRKHLEFALELYASLDVDQLLKLDSDTVLFVNPFTDWPVDELVGVLSTERRGIRGVYGAAQLISRAGVERLWKAAHKELNWEILKQDLRRLPFPEDLSVSNLHRIAGGTCTALPMSRMWWLAKSTDKKTDDHLFAVLPYAGWWATTYESMIHWPKEKLQAYRLALLEHACQEGGIQI